MRVMSRFMDDHSCIDKQTVKCRFSSLLSEIYPEEAGTFTQSLMELGAVVCLPNGQPRCDHCPLQDICLARLRHSAGDLPVRSEKKKRKQESMTVFLLTCENRLALRKRPDTGLLAGLYELPNLPGSLTAEEIISAAVSWGLHPHHLEKIIHRTHIFTHIQWNMAGARIHCGQESDTFLWVDQKAVLENKALPTAFRQFLPDIWEDLT